MAERLRQRSDLAKSFAMRLPSNQTRVQWVSAIVLALVAGYLDGYGLLFLGVYVSFMSGNMTMAGLKSGQGVFNASLPPALAVLFFIAGSFLGNLFSQSRLRHSSRMIFGIVAGVLATVARLDRHALLNAAFEIAMLSLAMGMMNAALSRIGSEPVSLTFITGMLNRAAGHLAAAVRQKPAADGQGSGNSPLARARIDGSIWSGFLLGAVLSGIAGSHFRTWALFPPCVVMIAMALFGHSVGPSPGGANRSPHSGIRTESRFD